MALKSAENFKNSNSKQFGNLAVVIYSCEESTRFKTACLGSYYLSGELPYEKAKTLKDKDGITLEDAISEYKNYIFSHLAEYKIDLNNIKLVDKVLNKKEISEAIESHIEQSQILSEAENKIGIIDSIGKPLRGTIYINGNNSIVTSAKIITSLNKLSRESKSENQEELLRITVPEFNSIPNKSNLQVAVGNNDLLKIKASSKKHYYIGLSFRRFLDAKKLVYVIFHCIICSSRRRSCKLFDNKKCILLSSFHVIKACKLNFRHDFFWNASFYACILHHKGCRY